MSIDPQVPESSPGPGASWSPCPPGAVRRVVAALRAKRRWSAFVPAGTIVAVLLVASVGLWFAVNRYIYGSNDPTSAYGMTCPEVWELLPEFIDGKLSSSQSADIEWHLEHCRRCFDRYRAFGGKQVFAEAVDWSEDELQDAGFTPPGAPPSTPSCAKPCCGAGSP